MAQNDGSPDTTHLYAWIARDADGIQGIISAPLPGLGVVPLVCTGMANANNLRPLALIAAKARGEFAELRRFDYAETLEIHASL